MSKLKSPTPNSGSRFKASAKTPEWRSQTPTFCLKLLSKDKNFGLEKADKTAKAELITALYKRSGLQWSELQNDSRKNLGFELMEPKAIKGIPSDITYDGKFYVFRVKPNTKSRLIGYRVNNTFHIILYDRHGKSYSHD